MAMKGTSDPHRAVNTAARRSRLGTFAQLAVAAMIAACIAPAMAQTANTKTTYSYDALDRLTQVTDPSGLNTTYQYDGLSDPTTLTSPDTGVTARTYDAAGNVLTGTDANNNTVTYTYDAQNRRLSASYADSTQNITYTYDEPNTATGCSSSYPIGHLTHIVESTVSTAFCYNAQGYVTQVSQTVNGTTDVTTYTRSPGGKILSISYPSGNQVSYSYDTDGRVSGMTATTSAGTNTLVSNVSYLPFGPINGYTLGNGQAVTRTYDANYRLTDLTSPAFNLHVARDAMGDITAIGNAAGATPATETYSYDPLYRLTQITEADGSTLESVTYNPTGDRLTKTGSGLATGTYNYNTNTHQLIATGTAARTVDADGNTTAITQAGSTYGFGYNARNRMSLAQLNQSTVANYTYNASGQRVAKTTNGNTERYNYGPDSQLLGEYGNTNREYVYLDGIPVANLDTQGTTSSIAYVTADELGTPRAIADSTGTTEWSWAYQGNPWGEQSPTSNGYTYNPRFPGQYFDVETGLNYNGHRDYDSATGREIESDPTGLRGGVNTYAYVGGNPLNYIDPFGLQTTGTIDPDSVNWDQRAADNANLFGWLFLGTDIDKVNPPGDDSIQSVSTPLEFALAGGITRGVGAASRAMCAASNAARATTPLFRAVNPSELQGLLENNGSFSNPLGIENKYFSTTAEGAASYAQQTYGTGLYEGPYTIVQSSIPTGSIDPLMQTTVDGGIPTVTIPTNMLPGLSPGTPLNYTPLPPGR